MELQPSKRPGWATWVDAPEGLSVELRFEQHGGRLRVRGIRMEAVAPLASDDLRAVPVGRAEAALNAPAFRQALAATSLDRVKVHDLGQRVAALQPIGEPTGFAVEQVASTANRHPDDLVLQAAGDRPRQRPDLFYADVADMYSRLATTSRRPAADLAEANGVPVSTVHRWIRTARERGHLPHGRRGAAG